MKSLSILHDSETVNPILASDTTNQPILCVSAFPKKAAAKPKKQAIVISEDEDDSSPSKSQSKSKKSRDYSSDEDNTEVITYVVHILFHETVITFGPFFVI